MFASKDLFFTKPSGGYQISRSVRLRSSASAYFNRTPATTTNRRTWTVSFWIKRGKLFTGTEQAIFGSNNGTTFTELNYFASSDVLRVNLAAGSATYTFDTTAVFRDPSAWYHVVLAVDTTQATSTDRIKIYINGVQQVGTNTPPTLNYDTQWNVAQAAFIGSRTASTWFTDCYLTDFYNIDGQALTPSSFGQTNSVTGVWQPIKYAGTYGTNGFYLNFSDNSNNTATTIGKDNSGNGNNWTPNNISVTAGTTYDSMLDVPTPYADGGNGRGNYAVMNPLKATAGTYSSANLGVVRSSAPNVDLPVSTLQIPKTVPIYLEISFGNQDSSYGIAKDTSDSGANGIVGSSSDGASYGAYVTTSSSYYGFWNNNSRTSFNFSGGTIYQMAFDQANGKLWFGKDNTWYNSGNPTNGTNPTFSSISTTTDFFIAALATTSAASVNFGQRPFSYTPPTGFVALNTQNLPTPTISNGANYMAASTYTGTGATQTIANSGNNAGAISFQPDFVWVKGRSGATDHALYDSVRGTTKDLVSNSTAAETTQATGLTAFGSTGFTVGALAKMNTNTATYVGWQWQAGGTSSSNTNGSITSTVSAGATQGFSVVTYSGNSVAGATVGHGLGVAPKFVIVKARSGGAENWYCWHTGLSGATYYVALNLTSAQTNDNTRFYAAPTSTVITLGGNSGVSATGYTYVAYCFSEIAGYSKFGSYTGNASTDGPFVFTNFQPRWVMVKRTDSTSDWYIWDTSRDTYNVETATLLADTSDAETSATSIDGLSNGFKCRSATVVNASGGTYIYAAFASSPFRNSLAR